MFKLRSVALQTVTTAALILSVGCGGGVNDKLLNDAQGRIDQLKAKGVPDSVVSNAKVYLYSARDEHDKGNGGKAKKAADSMKVALAEAEKHYQEQISNLGPKIEASKSAALKAKEGLTGYQARKIDSVLAVVDSFKNMDWLLPADTISEKLVKQLPGLKDDEDKSSHLKKLVPGEWFYTEKDRSVEHPAVNAVSKKLFKFGSDGKVRYTESKSGQSGPYLKEDWLFESWGTYGYKGDTIMLSINRFAAVKQMFKRVHKIDGKEVWKDEPGPTYDSVITDGSQDRTITFDDLKVDFKKIK